MKVARLLRRPKRGSNDYSDYNDNGMVKPVQSLISCIIIGTSHTSVFRCIYTVNSQFHQHGNWIQGWDRYHARVEQPIHLDENGLKCVCVCACASICICVCKPADEHTNGICVFSASEVSWYVMGGEQAGRDSKECIATVDTPTSVGRQSIFFAASLKMPLSYQGCLASKQASGHRASKGVYFPRNNGQTEGEKVNRASCRSPT